MPTNAADGEARPADAAPRAPKPIVIDRYKYKQDGQGYLLSGRHSYIYLFDIATKKLDRLTKGKWDEVDAVVVARRHPHRVHEQPQRGSRSRAVEPDLRRRREARVDRESADAGHQPRRPLAPEWSPDGKWIAFLEGDEKKYGAYGMEHLALVAADGSERAAAREGGREPRPRRVVAAFQRRRQVDHRVRHRRPVRLSGARSRWRRQRVERLMPPPVVVSNWTTAGSCSVVLSGSDTKPTEVYRAGRLARCSQLTHQNDALFAELQLGADRRGQLQEQGRHGGARPADQAGRLRHRHEGSAAAADSRRAERAGSALVQRSSASCSRPTATRCSR